MARYQDAGTIAQMLRTARTIAVVGLSPDPLRPSHQVAAYLQRHGYHVIPVNPTQTEVLGEPCYPSLAEVPERVDIVDVFRRSEAVPAVARDAVAIAAGALWCQLGVINVEAARMAAAAGLAVVMDRCIEIDHARYLSRIS